LARRLITTISGALLVVALTTAAAAAVEPTIPPSSTAGGDDTPPTTASPTTSGSTTTTTTTPPDPPAGCQEPDNEEAISAAQVEYVKAAAAAGKAASKKYKELGKQGPPTAPENPIRIALDAALEEAQTAESIEAAFAVAAVSTNAYYDAFLPVAEAHKAALREAGNIARDALLRACEDPAAIEFFMTDSVEGEISVIDAQIQGFEKNRKTDLTALEAEKAAALDALAGDGDGDGDGPPPTQAPGGGDTPSDDSGQEGDDDGGTGLGALPFAGTAALPLLIAGFALVGAGAAAVILSRRRREGESDT
jgi:hypothetical protein